MCAHSGKGNGVIAAMILAMAVGFGVYQSCTKFSHMRRKALTFDAIHAVLLATIFYLIGAWS